MRTVQEINRDIDAIHDEMKQKYPGLRRVPRLWYGRLYLNACKRWQAAWDAEPELRAQEQSLCAERHDAQVERERKWEREQRRLDAPK